MHLGFSGCAPRRPSYYARKTHTEKRSIGFLTHEITVTREYRSDVSLAHAELRARECAEREARAAMECLLRQLERGDAIAGCYSCAVYNYFDNTPTPEPMRLPPGSNLAVSIDTEATIYPVNFTVTWSKPDFVPVGMRIRVEGVASFDVVTGPDDPQTVSGAASNGGPLTITLTNHDGDSGYLASFDVVISAEIPLFP